MAPRALEDSVRPRRLSDVVVRPLNFTVSCHAQTHRVDDIALGTFIAGVLLGFGGSHMIYKAKLMAYEMIDTEYMATYVEIQHYQGTPQTYESALRDYLEALERRERAGRGFLSQAIPVSKAMTYARLALLAAERNDLSAASKYRSQAEALCPEIGWKSCSADVITRLVQRVDEHSIWKPSQPSSSHGS